MTLCPADKKHFSYSLRLRGAPVGNRQLKPDQIKGLPISSEMHVHPPPQGTHHPPPTPPGPEDEDGTGSGF